VISIPSKRVVVAVIGANGQLGRELCRQLGSFAVGVHRTQCDVCQKNDLRRVLLEIRPTIVINTAAYTQVDRAEREPLQCWAVNATGVANLVSVCRELDCPFVQISTDYVFGEANGRGVPYTENDVPSPCCVYGQSKLAGERFASEWDKHFIIRTCGLYGDAALAETATNFVNVMLRLSAVRTELGVVDDQYCTPTYLPDLVSAIRYLMTTSNFGTYHIVNSEWTSWYGFASEIFKIVDSPVRVRPISTAEFNALAPRPAFSVLDTSKYHRLDGPSMPTWRESLLRSLSPGSYACKRY
jgi:dTDP-4-dehydrorhamnose reductase